jgi:beta-lactamase superfamily II metal-dependent hydrolase
MNFKHIIIVLAAAFIFLSCEDRIFLDKTPDIIYEDGKYYFDPAGYEFDKVILSKDDNIIELSSCRESGSVLTVFKNDVRGYYDMFVISGEDTVFSRETYIGATEQNSLNIAVLDVKQGDSFIIDPPDGKPSVMDGGYGTLGYYFWQDGGASTLLNELNRRNVTDLKYIVETHHDKDHYGGLYDVIAAGNVSYEDTLSYRDPLPDPGDTLYFSDKVKGVMLHYGNIPEESVISENDRSVAIKMIFYDFEMIFTGDIEEDAESAIISRGLLDPSEKYEILKAAHHGSPSSSTQGFLNAVMPLYSVISVGYSNDYGHPSAEILDRLKTIGSDILRTDLNSNIEIFTDGHSFQVTYKK